MRYKVVKKVTRKAHKHKYPNDFMSWIRRFGPGSQIECGCGVILEYARISSTSKYCYWRVKFW